MAVIELDEETFDEQVSDAEGLTVVDFWAPWCGPCRMVSPALEELASEYAGQVRFAKVNVDENPQLAAFFGIRSIPTIGFFKDGETVGAVIGARPKAALKQTIEQLRGAES